MRADTIDCATTDRWRAGRSRMRATARPSSTASATPSGAIATSASLMVGETTTLRAGMTFTVEPSVLLLDRAYVRIEDIVHVTPDGAENL